MAFTTKKCYKNVEPANRYISIMCDFFIYAFKGLLAFYGLPLPHTLVELNHVAPPPHPHHRVEGVKFELQTLPVRNLTFQTFVEINILGIEKFG